MPLLVLVQDLGPRRTWRDCDRCLISRRRVGRGVTAWSAVRGTGGQDTSRSTNVPPAPRAPPYVQIAVLKLTIHKDATVTNSYLSYYPCSNCNSLSFICTSYRRHAGDLFILPTLCIFYFLPLFCRICLAKQ